MKTLKIPSLLSSILLMLISFTGCKKNKTEAPISTTVTADDLVNYNIIVIFKDATYKNQYLELFSFSKAGDQVTATLDGLTYRRAHVINVVNNSFTFDFDGDGKAVYTIILSKDNTGKLTLTDVKYVNQTASSYKSDGWQIYKSTGLPSLKNSSFISTVGNNTLDFMTDGTWTLSSVPNVTGTFYEISAGAWKGNLGGKDYMGASFYNDTKLVLVFQTSNQVVIYISN